MSGALSPCCRSWIRVVVNPHVRTPCLRAGGGWGAWAASRPLRTSKCLLFLFFFFFESKPSMLSRLIVRLWGDQLCTLGSSSINQGDACSSAPGPPLEKWCMDAGWRWRGFSLCHPASWSLLGKKGKKKKRLFFFFCALLMNAEISGLWITEVLRIALMRHHRLCCVFPHI